MVNTENGKKRYIPLNRLEQEKVDKVGVILLVFSTQNHNVWVIEERKTKKSTGKVSGQIGVPAETRKQEEFICDNVRGALVEEMGIDENHPARKDFYYIDGMSYQGRYKPEVTGKEVHGDVVALLYDGDPNITFWPQAGEFGSNEVAPVGWMKLEDLQRNKKLRAGLQPPIWAIVNNDGEKNLLEHWHLYKIGKGNRVRQVFADGFVRNDRETKIDAGK